MNAPWPRSSHLVAVASLLVVVGCSSGPDATGGGPEAAGPGAAGPGASVPPAGGPSAPGASGPDAPGPSAPPPPELALSPCQPSGQGKDYQVGPGAGQLASLDLVPWEALGPGDTVRIFHRATPYAGKFAISAKGTKAAPVRVCGVRGPGNERPIIDGKGATTRPALLGVYGNKAFDQDVHQARSVIVVKQAGNGSYTDAPENIQIDGLAIRRAHPDYTFTDAAGASKPYDAFGACVWLERGHGITIADNELSDCSQGLFSKSTDEGAFAVTKDVRIAGNRFSSCGILGDEHMHASYVQSVGVVYELNTYGKLRPGAAGNSIKDRSVGAVIRYNRIEDGAHAIDLVESEDFPLTATSDPAYRSTFVYGNQITKDGSTGSFIHYGGDHYGSTPGAQWGEPIFRKGTLYFFYNTVYATGSDAALFQISTTEEKASIWNNVFVFADSVTEKRVRASQEIGAGWTSGGVVELGVNWASAGVEDSDVYHPVAGSITGMSALLTGAAAPIDLTTFVPTAGSPILDRGAAGPSAAAAYTVDLQLDGLQRPVARTKTGAGLDLGAVER